MGRKKTATHEAGHAVVALHVGMRWQDVTIRPDGDSLGRINYSPDPVVDEIDEYLFDKFQADSQRLIYAKEFLSRFAGEQRIMAACAGALAEELAGYKRHGMSIADYKIVTNTVLTYLDPAEQTELHVAWLKARTRQILERHWRCVKAVRDDLLEKETLQREEVGALLRKWPWLGPPVGPLGR